MTPDPLGLLDWRRRMAALYAAVRAALPDDPQAAHARWRAGRDELFATHPQSPLPEARRRAFRGLAVADYDPAFAFSAAVEPEATQRHELPRSRGGPGMAMVRFGSVSLPVGRLPVYWVDDYGGGLLVPFRDATSGSQTYGGGRYLLDTAKGADLGSTAAGELICDFNFATHPSCFHDDAWSCPLAPPDGWLSTAIPVGELAR